MTSTPLTYRFDYDGDVPTSPYPALVYRRARDLSASKDPEDEVENLFRAKGWGREMWRNGVFPYVHYHPKIHEALGIARGSATLRIGGDRGQTLTVEAGDVLVLPAGTGHQRISPDDGFCVIGAYARRRIQPLPRWRSGRLCTRAEDAGAEERSRARRE